MTTLEELRRMAADLVHQRRRTWWLIVANVLLALVNASMAVWDWKTAHLWLMPINIAACIVCLVMAVRSLISLRELSSAIAACRHLGA